VTTATRPLALVTGASSGIGRELAVELAARDYDLVLAAEDGDLSTVGEGAQRSGASVVTVTADLATDAGVEKLVGEVEGLGRPVDVLCLNAGVGNAGPFIETPLEDDLRLIALNVDHVVHTAKRLLPGMVQRGEGRVLITSSIAALMPGPWYATYAASKAFLQSFAEAIRYELKDTGVTVTALLPGPTDTDFFDRANLDGTVADEGPKDDPADVARDGIEAMLAGKDHVVAGSWRNKVQAVLSKGGPDSLKAAMHAQQTKEK
jgi:short-subunit dehydrogenase